MHVVFGYRFGVDSAPLQRGRCAVAACKRYRFGVGGEKIQHLLATIAAWMNICS